MAVSIWEILTALKQGGYIVHRITTKGVTQYGLYGPENEHKWHPKIGSVSSAMFSNLYQTGLLIEGSQKQDKNTTLYTYFFLNEHLPGKQEVHCTEEDPALRKYLLKCELQYRVDNSDDKIITLDWLKPYCSSVNEIADFLRSIGFRIKEIMDEENSFGDKFKWVETTSGIIVYAETDGWCGKAARIEKL